MRNIRNLIIISAVLSIAPSLLLGDAKSQPPPEVQSAWDALKKLAGEWEGQPGQGNAPGTAVIYRVTSAGNTVMETLLPGSDHEMVSMYHLDGKNLVMTHYCAAGNQPHLVFDVKASKPGVLVFSFAGGTNLDPAKDGHIHSARLTLVDADHLESDWESYENNQLKETAKFVLVRKK